MSPILKLCRCGALIQPGIRFCPACQVADDKRRNTKRTTSGRSTAAWQRLRLAAIERDGHACQDCGKVGTVATLTVHLDPRLGGNHRGAALEDLKTLCPKCHGSRDAPRAHASHAVPIDNGPARAPSIG